MKKWKANAEKTKSRTEYPKTMEKRCNMNNGTAKSGKTKKKKFEIMTENFPKVMSDTKPEIELAQRIPSRKIFHNKNISYHY